MQFQYYEDAGGDWRWRLVARNNRVVADGGEGYYDLANAQRAVRSFCQSVHLATHKITKEKTDDL